MAAKSKKPASKTGAEERRYRASHRHARIAPRKARLVAAMVRGMPVNDALAALEHSPKRAAFLMRKIVRSAMANASNDLDVDLNALVVRESRVDEGPLLGGRARWRPRAQGRATPIHKRTSHIIVGLAEEDALRTRRSRRGAAAPTGTPTGGGGAEETGAGDKTATEATE